MAKVHGQSVPGSLADAFGSIFEMAKVKGSTAKQARMAKGFWTPGKAEDPSPFGRLVSESAAWLTAAWAPNSNTAARSAFFTARAAEIRAADLQAPYWTPATLTEDRTERGVPTLVEPFSGEINPAYADPLRMPSYIEWRDFSTIYPTPTGQGTPGAEAPGWSGHVEAALWRDDYLAQRRLSFTLPAVVPAEAGRPVVIVLDSTVTAAATRRGVKTWFTIHTAPRFYSSTGYYQGDTTGMFTGWEKDFATPIQIPASNPAGWEHTLTRRIIRDGRANAEFRASTTANRLYLRIVTPPSRGIYYGRNDLVTVYHQCTAAVYIGRGPNG